MKLTNELIKNFRLILRSWSSLVLLILGPLLIILIIGLTLSGDRLHDVRVGVFTNDSSLPSQISDVVSTIGELQTYNTLASCLVDQQQGRTHVCVSVQQDEKTKQTRYLLYHDPGQKKLNAAIIQELTETLGSASSEISIQATRSLIENIQELVEFLKQGQATLSTAVDEAKVLQGELEQRQERLGEAQTEFSPKYLQVKTAQQELRKIINTTEASLQNYSTTTSNLATSLQGLQTFLRVLPSQLPNTTSPQVLALITQTATSMTALINTTASMNIDTSGILHSLENLSSSVDTTIEPLDEINTLLSQEIIFNAQAVNRTNQSITSLENEQHTLQKQIESLSAINPNLAEFLSSPIIQELVKTSELSTVQLSFSGLLLMVTMFISLLFANILTLAEINSPAFMRNLIAPVPRVTYLIGLALTNIILVLFQVTILIIVAQTMLDVHLAGSLGHVYALILLPIILFTCIGMTFAFIVRNSQTSVLTTTFFALAVYLFSSFITPVQLMPAAVALVAQFNPIALAENVLRLLITYNTPISNEPGPLMLLVAFIIIAAIVALMTFKRAIRRQQ